MQESFMSVWQHIWISFYGLMDYEIQFPEPIGYMSTLDMVMFFGVAYLLADAVATVASRGE